MIETKKNPPTPSGEKTTSSNNNNSYLYLNCNTRFRSLARDEIIEFFDRPKVRGKFEGRYLPVNLDKDVVTGGASSSASRVTNKGLRTIANNKGTLIRVEGLNDDEERTHPLKAVGFASQHRYQSLGIDLDCIVFNGHGGTGLPYKLGVWVDKHYDRGLLVRGNRKRMLMLFLVTEELSQKLRDSKRHALHFTLVEGIGQKVELNFGDKNNTIWGAHPSGNDYQQILPESGEVGTLDVADYEELIEILEEISVPKEARYKGSVSGDRIHLCDSDDLLDGIHRDIYAYEQINDAYTLGCEFKLNIMELLSSQSQKIINGQGYFDGSGFIESDDECPIAEGGRYYTWFNVGSDVNLILGILDKCSIDYEPDDVDAIIERMMEFTEIVVRGKRKFTEHDAIAAFKATEDYPSANEGYLMSLAKKIRNKLQLKLQDAIDKAKVERKQELSTRKEEIAIFHDLEKECENKDNLCEVTEDDRVKNFDPDKSLEENGFDFDAIFDEEIVKTQTPEEKQAQSIREKMEERLQKIKEEEEEKQEIVTRVFSDTSNLFGKKTRYMASIGREMYGNTYSIVSQTSALFASMGSYVQAKNDEYAPHKPSGAKSVYSTNFIPFGLNVGDSGIGKTQLYDRVNLMATNVVSTLGRMTDQEQMRFIFQFTDQKTDRFKKVEIDPVTGQPLDPTLNEVRNIIKSQMKMDIHDYSNNQDFHTINDMTSAGVRRVISIQSSRCQLRKATDSIHFGDAFKHPMQFYSDEIGGLMKQITDPKAQYITPFQLFEYKGAKPMTVIRGDVTYKAEKCGISIAGNITSRNFRQILKKEATEGTDGLLPRFYFSPLYKKSEEELFAITDWDVDHSRRAQLDVTGMAICIRYASIHAETLGEKCPWNGGLVFGKDAQQQYDEHSIVMKKEELRLSTRYPLYGDFIHSVFGKANSELSIWAQAMKIWDTAEDMWFAIKDDLNLDDIVKKFDSRDRAKIAEAVHAIERALSLLFTKFEWNNEIDADQVARARDMMMHHYAFLELSLYEISGQDKDLDGYVKKLQQENIIAKNNPEVLQISKGTGAVLEVIPKLIEEKPDGFTASEITRRSNFLKTKGSPALVETILDTLLGMSIVQKIESGSKVKYVSMLTKQEFVTKKQQLLSTMVEFVL